MLGSVHYFLRMKKSKQCSDLGWWVGHGKMDVWIYKSVGSKNMFLSRDQRIFQIFCGRGWVGHQKSKHCSDF